MSITGNMELVDYAGQLCNGRTERFLHPRATSSPFPLHQTYEAIRTGAMNLINARTGRASTWLTLASAAGGAHPDNRADSPILITRQTCATITCEFDWCGSVTLVASVLTTRMRWESGWGRRRSSERLAAFTPARVPSGLILWPLAPKSNRCMSSSRG